MSRSHGKNSRVLLNTLSVTGQITGFTFAHSRQYAPVAVAGDEGDHWLPGQISGRIGLKGLLDTEDGLHSEAIASAGVDDGVLITICPAAYTVGAPALFGRGDQSSFMNDAQIRAAVTAVLETQGDDGIDTGYLLHGLTEESADDESASVDNTAGTTGGLVATLHVTDYDALTSIVVTVEHSTNNSVWTTLATFATATDVTQERIKVSGTVNRYLRAAWNVTGTGTATFAVAAARR